MGRVKKFISHEEIKYTILVISVFLMIGITIGEDWYPGNFLRQDRRIGIPIIYDWYPDKDWYPVNL